MYFEVFHKNENVTDRYGSAKVEIDYYVGQCPICGRPVILDAKTSSALPPVKSFDEVKELPSGVRILAVLKKLGFYK